MLLYNWWWLHHGLFSLEHEKCGDNIFKGVQLSQNDDKLDDIFKVYVEVVKY